MKRGRKDQLTGGSGDVNPQNMTVTVTQPAVDTPVAFAQNLPIPRFPTRTGYNLVIEALGLTIYRLQGQNIAANSNRRQTESVTTRPNAPTNLLDQLQDPRKIAAWSTAFETAAGATLGPVRDPVEKYIDLTDQAGHGVLIATDVLYFVITSANLNACQVVFQLEYRWKEVTLTEYIGIVQSQQ